MQQADLDIHIIDNTVNGLRLVCKPMAGLHSAAIGVWLHNGCRHEQAQQQGYAHFFEHLVFRRTRRHTGKALSRLFESMGGAINAQTGRELTGFYGHVPSNRSAEFLQLLLDMLLQPAFNQQDFALERDVVLQELAMLNDDPEEALEDFATEQVWPAHSMGRQILGSRQSIGEATLEALYAYARQIVHRENLLIVAVGDLDIAALQQVCRDNDCASGVPANSSTPQFVTTDGKLDLGCEQTQLQWLMPAVAYTAAQAPRYDIANQILAGGYDSRLYQTLREQMGLVYSIDSQLEYYRDTGLWFIQTNTEAQQRQQVSAAVQQVLQDLIDTGPTQQELHNACQHLQASHIIDADDLQTSMENIAQDMFYCGAVPSLEQKLAAYEQVTPASLQELYAQSWQQVATFRAQ